MKRVVWIAVGLLLGAGLPAMAQGLYAEGDFSCLMGVDWHSRCDKPDFVSISADDRAAIASDYDTYQECVVRKAKSDSAYAAQRVIDSAKRELDETKDEARAAGWTVN